MLGYKYRKVWSAKNTDIQETMIEIADICEAILEGTSKATLYTGHREGDGSVEYKVKTGSDNGSTVTKVRANSPEEARKLVQKMYGGPDSAHQVLEAITDVCLSIIGEKEEKTNEGPFKEMNKDIDTFFKKADEFIQKRKEQNKKKK